MVDRADEAPAGRSPFVEEWSAFSDRYHEDLARLDKIRDGLEQAAKTDADLETLLVLAEVCFVWGDVRATTTDRKMAAYERGRQAGKRAVAMNPNSAAAHFWYAINTARWGQIKGIMRSLSVLPVIEEEIQTVFRLEPGFPKVYGLAGNFAYELPSLLGGDVDRAEALFRKGLALDPKFTVLRVGLGKTLIEKRRWPEARRELEAVLNETEPRNLADWTMKDSKEARALLDSIRGKA